MGQAVSDQREQSGKAVLVIFICPALQISGETAKPLFPSVDTISTINRTNMGHFALFPVTVKKKKMSLTQTEVLPIVIAY